MDSKKISDLEHALLKKEIENISYKMHEGFSSIEAFIKAHFDALQIKNDSEAEVKGVQLNNILVEQKKTNGRVTKQEKITEIIRIMQDHKTFTALITYTLYNFLEAATVSNIWKLIKSII